VLNPRSHVSRKDEFRRTLVRRGASIGANATVVCGATLGEYAFVGAGSVVSHDVPDHALVFGVPARIRGWMCRCGLKLGLLPSSAAGKTVCAGCGDRYEQDGDGVRRVASEER
jgi:UDP-2-acetamido-3-amino-2,3-dideoxy-glucuronate N-acetyltransferase